MIHIDYGSLLSLKEVDKFEHCLISMLCDCTMGCKDKTLLMSFYLSMLNLNCRFNTLVWVVRIEYVLISMP